MNKQKRYEQTPKGKAARARAIANYKAKLARWDCTIDPALHDAVMAQKPEGMTKRAYLEKIFQRILDIGM